ncbi:hypothetical protein N8622_02500 [bacterium]|nr:hypothetical protein [bacterium]
MKHLLLTTIIFLIFLVWVIYDIKSSIKTGEARIGQMSPFLKKEHPGAFEVVLMLKILFGCGLLCGFVKFVFDLLKMLW